MSKKKDGHGGSIAGQRAETKTRIAVEGIGWKFLKVKKEFEDTPYCYLGTIRFQRPEDYCLVTGKGYFLSDGLLVAPDGKVWILETKNSNIRGSAEEKVFYDLEKIKDGIYGNKYPLIYLFTGPNCEKVNEFLLFEKRIKELKLENVTVLFDPTPGRTRLKEFLNSQDYHE
tara:strand:+ start:1681 stop:2193 length:513 start_codon:yes stop_codon:yes gene_type:complete